MAAIDDDPTGTQTVSGVRVSLGWSLPDLRRAIASADTLFFVCTNSRGLAGRAAGRLGEVVGRRLRHAARREAARVVLLSRSDSTLRGHFPVEVDGLARGFGFASRRRHHRSGVLRGGTVHRGRRPLGRAGRGPRARLGDGVRAGSRLRVHERRPAIVGRGEDRRPVAGVRSRLPLPRDHPRRRTRRGRRPSRRTVRGRARHRQRDRVRGPRGGGAGHHRGRARRPAVPLPHGGLVREGASPASTTGTSWARRRSAPAAGRCSSSPGSWVGRTSRQLERVQAEGLADAVELRAAALASAAGYAEEVRRVARAASACLARRPQRRRRHVPRHGSRRAIRSRTVAG